jgi:hypothetical protein
MLPAQLCSVRNGDLQRSILMSIQKKNLSQQSTTKPATARRLKADPQLKGKTVTNLATATGAQTCLNSGGKHFATATVTIRK